eukprot:TRINITY_DN8004_c0_g3_i1.p1 TRINITY_DN8004_c0_g3~~TRINITY_DN8004_c0_g3_i1.p1  ORF type:complete len:607 (+),score=217.93 TRINITY_DN8004_c0_g3_i1:24-1844(+)
MFKNVIWNLVEYYAHKYVNGFRPEDLRVSLWQGHVSMNNIELNTEELQSLNLPVNIKRGFIKELSVNFPWTSLLSDSIVAEVNGITLELYPNHDFGSSPSSSSSSSAAPSPFVAGAVQPVQMGSSRSGTLSNSGSAEETPASPKDDPSLNRSTSSSAIPRQGFTAAVPSGMSLSRKDGTPSPRSGTASPPTSMAPSPSTPAPSPLSAPSRPAETKAVTPLVEPKLEREEEVYEEEVAEEEEEIEEIEVTVQPKKKFWQTGGMQIGMIASEINQKNIPRIATTMMSTGLKPEELDDDYGEEQDEDDGEGEGKEEPLFLKEVKPLPSGSRRNAPTKRSADPNSSSASSDGHKQSTSTRPAAPAVGAGRGGPGAGGFGRGQGPQPPSGGFRGGLGSASGSVSPGPTRGGIVAPAPVSATVVSRAPAPVPTQAPAPTPVAVAPAPSPAGSGGSKRGAPGPVAGGDSTRGAPAGGSGIGGQPRGGAGGGPAERGGPGGGPGSARGARGGPGAAPAAGSGGSARGSPAGAPRGGGAGMPGPGGQGQGQGAKGGAPSQAQPQAQPAAVVVGETKPAVSKIYRPGPAAGGRKRDDPNTRTIYSAMPDFGDSDEE